MTEQEKLVKSQIEVNESIVKLNEALQKKAEAEAEATRRIK